MSHQITYPFRLWAVPRFRRPLPDAPAIPTLTAPSPDKPPTPPGLIEREPAEGCWRLPH